MDTEKIIIISKELLNQIVENEKIQTILFAENHTQEDVEAVQGNPAIMKFLQTPIGSTEEKQVKKIITNAVILAKENDCLPFDIPSSDPIEIAKIVDDGLTRLKTTYKVGVGELTTSQMLETLVDQQTARVTALVDKAFESGLVNKLATEGTVCLLKFLEVPAPEAYKPLISNVVKRIEEPAKKVIHKAINIVANTCKQLINKVVGTVKEKVKQFITQ